MRKNILIMYNKMLTTFSSVLIFLQDAPLPHPLLTDRDGDCHQSRPKFRNITLPSRLI